MIRLIFSAGAGALDYTYDNTVWALNDPDCSVQAVRSIYFGKIY